MATHAGAIHQPAGGYSQHDPPLDRMEGDMRLIRLYLARYVLRASIRIAERAAKTLI